PLSTTQAPLLDGGLTSGFSPTRMYDIRTSPSPSAIAYPWCHGRRTLITPDVGRGGCARRAFVRMQKSDTCARYRTVGPIDTSPKLQTLDAIVDHSGEATLAPRPQARSEEHTSELQSRVDLVCRLLL